MSVGVWNENANHDDSAEMLKAVKRAQKRTELLESLKSRGLDNLVETAKSTKVAQNGGFRTKGNKGSQSVSKYPHRDTSAGIVRNCTIVFWDSDIKHIEYSPVTRYKGEETYVESRINSSSDEYTEMSPEWLITTFEGQKALDGTDALKKAYELLGF